MITSFKFIFSLPEFPGFAVSVSKKTLFFVEIKKIRPNKHLSMFGLTVHFNIQLIGKTTFEIWNFDLSMLLDKTRFNKEATQVEWKTILYQDGSCFLIK